MHENKTSKDIIKIAFWFDRPQEYSGGLNYIRNLLYALSLLDEKKVQPYVFFGSKFDKRTIDSFKPLATVITTELLQRNSILWLINKIAIKLFGSLFFVRQELKKHKISIISHAGNIYGRGGPLRIISWIPDFQYMHLPELFPTFNVKSETKRLQRIIQKSDVTVLSSYAALKDFINIAPKDCIEKGKVLQFVSQPSSKLLNEKEITSLSEMEFKYKFKGHFFFLPNQFWRHKNHKIVFEAIRILRGKDVNVLMMCTGNLSDYRLNNTSHADYLKKFVNENDLEENIRILGLIDYEDVLSLMKNCIAVINPSQFEGWSSTVEEAKSIGKKVVLSNIPVHLEQSPIDAQYFSPEDADGLAKILEDLWCTRNNEKDRNRENHAHENLNQRTIEFGKKYLEIVRQLNEK